MNKSSHLELLLNTQVKHFFPYMPPRFSHYLHVDEDFSTLFLRITFSFFGRQNVSDMTLKAPVLW